MSLFFADLILRSYKITKSKGPSIVYFLFISRFHGNQPAYALFFVDFRGQNALLKSKPDFVVPETPGTSLYTVRRLEPSLQQVWSSPKRGTQYFESMKIFLAFSHLEDWFCSLFSKIFALKCQELNFDRLEDRLRGENVHRNLKTNLTRRMKKCD